MKSAMLVLEIYNHDLSNSMLYKGNTFSYNEITIFPKLFCILFLICILKRSDEYTLI